MREAVLKSYFEGTVGPRELASDLIGATMPGSAPGVSPAVVRHRITDMDSDFEVTSDHLIKLCDDVLAGALLPGQLQAIGFCLLASDHFTWTEDPPDSDRIARTLHDWTAPEINYQLTLATVAKFKHRLLTGESRFGPGDYFSASTTTGS